MKQFRSKSLAAQRKLVELSLGRTRKALAEMRELSMRDWKGGEAETARKVRVTVDQLETALENLKNAEHNLKILEQDAARKGK